ncbi:MAG: DUF2071 domain-containing protein [Thermoanaerobaculia bacterium]
MATFFIGRQKWSRLGFLHWRIAPEDLRPLVPPMLEIETFDGAAWITLVPFEIRDSRPRFVPPFLPFPLVASFLELNLRTYVRHRDLSGVFFFSLDAASRLAVAAARATYHLPYFFAQMSMETADGRVEYESRRRETEASFRMSSFAEGELTTASATTLDHFLLERYALFAHHRGHIFAAHVRHHPYRYRPLTITRLEETVTRAAGIRLDAPPELAHDSPGVDVYVGSPQRH